MPENTGSVIGLTRNVLDRILFHTPIARRTPRAFTVIFILLYLVGILHWIWFFNWGNVSLRAFDWRKESAYLETLRSAIDTARLPLQWNQLDVQGTPNFLGIPEVSLTPDIVLLPWLDNTSFVLCHTLLFYSIGFGGTLFLAGAFNASMIAFIALWGFINFNGYITSHMATGHFQWLGYFLLPVFFVLLLRGIAVAREGVSFDALFAWSTALVLAVLFLNGSFHIAVWCLMFLVIVLPFRWKMWMNVAAAIVGTIGLSAGRLLPAAMSFWDADPRFISGYPTIGVLFDGLTVLLPYTFEVGNEVQGGLAWSEFDIFIGVTGFALLAGFSAVAVRFHRRALDFSLPVAGCLMFVLSLGSVYSFANALHVPLLNAERVSSRFIILPFIIALLAMIAGIDYGLGAWRRRTKVIILTALPLFFYEVFRHSSHWRISVLEQSITGQAPMPIQPSIVPNTDNLYGLAVTTGWIMSCVFFVIIIPLIVRAWRRSMKTCQVTFP